MKDEIKAIGEVAGVGKEFVSMCRDVLNIWAEPKRIKNEAVAKAEAISIINEAELSAEKQQFAQRAMLRFISGEMYKQKNLEEIATKALLLLANNAVPQKVSEEWLHRFSASAECSGDEILQDIWAHIMAEEVNQPNSISYRTLEFAKTLSKEDAQLIEKLSPFVFTGGAVKFIIQTQVEPEKCTSLSYLEWKHLEDIGIVNASVSERKFDKNDYDIWSNGKKAYRIYNPNDQEKRCPIFLLTKLGKDFMSVVTSPLNQEHIKKVCKFVTEKQFHFHETGLVRTYPNGRKIFCIHTIEE